MNINLLCAGCIQALTPVIALIPVAAGAVVGSGAYYMRKLKLKVKNDKCEDKIKKEEPAKNKVQKTNCSC